MNVRKLFEATINGRKTCLCDPDYFLKLLGSTMEYYDMNS
jgi:hypothetical protein